MPQSSNQKREGAGEPRPPFDPDGPNGKRTRVDASTSTRPVPSNFQSEIKAEWRQAAPCTDGFKIQQEGTGEEEEGEEQSRPLGSVTIYGSPDIPANRAALIRRLLESQEAVRHLEKADSLWGMAPAEYKRWFDAWYVRGGPTKAPWLMTIRGCVPMTRPLY